MWKHQAPRSAIRMPGLGVIYSINPADPCAEGRKSVDTVTVVTLSSQALPRAHRALRAE